MTDYDSLPGRRATQLKYLLTSPLAYRDVLDNPHKATPSLRLGTAEHCAVLEPDRFAKEYACNPYHGASKQGRAFKADRPGRVILNSTDYAKCVAMSRGFRRHPDCARYLDSLTSTERALTWTLDGRACKGRIDGQCGTVLLGLKTTRSVAGFARDAARLHYPLQWAWYHDGLDVLGERPSLVVELVVESAPPYDCACYVVPDSVLELGRDEYRRALSILDRCEATGQWPGAYPGETLLVLPDWAYAAAHPDEETLADDE